MTKPMVLVALLLAITLIHLVTAGTQLNGELGELSSTIEELKSTFTRELRNNGGKNKSYKRTKKSGHRKKNNKSRNRKKNNKSRNRKKNNKLRNRKNKGGQQKKKFGKRKNNIGKRKNKSVQHKRKAGRNMWGKMAKGNVRQTCDVQALCQKIKDFIKISNQLRKVKRIIKACALMENKAKKSITEFEATVASLTYALLVTRMPSALKRLSRSNASTVEDVTSIRDQLKNCTDTVKTKCDKTEVEACQNETILTKCEAELKNWVTLFGPAKGSCLQASDDCCSCINAIPDVSEQCLVFDKMSTIVVKKKTKCTNGNEEGSFGYCRKLQQEAAVKGPTVAKVYCQENVTTSTTSQPTTQPPANLTLNVTALEASVMSILDLVGNITSKLDATTAKVDATTAKVDANTGKVDANTAKVDANTVKVDANSVKVDANTVKVDAATTKVDANTVKVDANTAAIATKCDESKCGTIETKVDANVAAIATKCDESKCGTVETKVGNIESCLADTSSTTCPTAPSGKVSVPAAVTALETPPVFMCSWTGEGTDLEANKDPLAPYATCDVNVGSIADATTGIFTVPKAGKYRLTFMALMVPNGGKKTVGIMKKTTGATVTDMARSVTSTATESEITTTIDIISELAKDDTVHVAIAVKGGGKISSVVTKDPPNPAQLVFTGEFISA